MPRLRPEQVIAAIKASIGVTKLRKISDGNNLSLMTRNGRGYWAYSWREGASFRTKLLGSAADISPTKARQAREEIAVSLRAGHVDRRGIANRMAHPARAVTAGKLFGEVVTEYLAKAAPNWTGGLQGKEYHSYVQTLARTDFAKLAVAEIGTADVEAALEKFTPARAERVRARISKLLDYATVKGYRTGDNVARLKGHFEHLARPAIPKVAHHPSMAPAEVPALIRELLANGTSEAGALIFTILTAARTGETIGAKWQEIETTPTGVLWVVPADRMKGRPEDRTEHRVPLCAAALKLLGKRGAPGDFLFPSRAGRALWDNAMMALLRTLRPGYTVHGFRSTFSDWAAKAEYTLEVRERALHHAIGDAVVTAYQRDKLVELRRPMMDRWCKFALGAANRTKIIPGSTP